MGRRLTSCVANEASCRRRLPVLFDPETSPSLVLADSMVPQENLCPLTGIASPVETELAFGDLEQDSCERFFGPSLTPWTECR